MKNACHIFCILAILSVIPWVAANTSPPPQLPSGWQRISIPDVGTVDIPPTMEIQGSTLSNLSKKINKKIIQEDGSSDEGRIIIQQNGLNELDPEASKLYVRIMISTTIGSPGDCETLGSRFSASQDELRDVSLTFREQVENQNMRILQWDVPSVEMINEVQAIKLSYRRQINDNVPVRVIMYLIQNYDRMHYLTMSYRETEKDLWLKDFDTILSSFRINNDRSPPKEAKSPMTTAFGENWVLTLVISAILTWGVGLTPPLITRFVLLRRPMQKLTTIIFVVVFWVINIMFFIAIGSRSKTHSALFLVALASYYILRSGWRKHQTTDTI